MATPRIRPPRPDAVATSATALGTPGAEFRVAAFGDSLMWGQGLRRADQFSWLIKEQLGIAAKKTPVLVADRSRSGAQIDERAVQRQEFVSRFPEVFKSRTERTRFIDGTLPGAQIPAERLYGEIPATFPTVRAQVAAVSDEVGKTVRVALVSGGANDIGFDEVINPTEFPGAFIERWDGRIKEIAYELVLDLIARVRRKCPKAVILQFGYYMPLSYRSSRSDIEAFFKHELDNDVGWWLNKHVPGVLDLLPGVDSVSVEQMVLEARIRGVWAAGRAQYWMRKAVADANADDAARGPGVVYVPAPFTDDMAAFGAQPMLHEDYSHPTTDPARQLREARCPRAAHLGALRDLWPKLILGTPSAATVKALRSSLTGPQPLLDGLAGDLSGRERLRLIPIITAEIRRIQRALIASFLHPNTEGARRYAAEAVRRYNVHTQRIAAIGTVVKPTSPAQLPGGSETLEERLERFGLRGTGPLSADVGHEEVDSLAVTVVTERASERLLAPDMTLVVTNRLVGGAAAGRVVTREFLLNFPYRITNVLGAQLVRKFYPHFEPAVTNFFTLNTSGELRLEQITGFAIAMGPDPVGGKFGNVWRPRRVQLEINGRVVHDQTFRNRELRPGQSLTLDYPPPARRPGGTGTVATARAGG